MEESGTNMLLKLMSMNHHISQLVGLVRWLIRRRSVTIFLKGGKLHFHAPIGLSVLVGWLFGWSVRRSVGRSVINF